MDDLLKEIRSKDEAAASVLEIAGLRADSDLRSLTLQELGELLPGAKNFKLRREIFDIIQTQKPIGELIKEFKNFIPHESLGTTLTENGILVNYLKMLKEMKNQMQTAQDFLDAHIRLLEDIRKSKPSQDQNRGSLSSSHNSQTGDPPQTQQDTSTSSSMLPPPSTTSTGDHPQKRKGEIMDVLLKEIRSKDGKAASILEKAGLRADSDLQLLTLQELGELFPGVENIKWRREIFAIIQTQKPIDVLIEEFKNFIRHESLRAALTENGVLVDYLKMLKEMKTQMKTVQGFLDAHINLLEDLRKSQPSQDQDKGSLSSSDNSQTGDPPQIQQDITASSAMMSPPSPTSTPDHPKKRSGSLSSSDNSQTGDPPQIQQDITASSAMMSPPSPTSSPDHPKKRPGSFSSSPAKRHNNQTSDSSQIQQDITASSAMMSPPSPTSTRDHPEERSGSLSSSDNSQTGDPPQIQQDITASSAMMSPPSPTSSPDHPVKRPGSLSSSDNSQTGDPPQIQQDITASSAMMSPPSPTSTRDHPEERSGSLSSSHNSQTGDPPQIQQDITASSAMMSPPSPTSSPDHPEKRPGSLSSSHNSQTGDPPQIQQDITASSAMMSPPSLTSSPDHPEKRPGSLSSSHNSQTGDPPQIQQDIIASSAMMSPPSPTSTPDHPEEKPGSLSSSDNSQTGDPPQIQQDITASSAMMSPPSLTSTPDHPEKRPGSLSSSHNSQTGDPPQIQQDITASSAMMSPPSPTSTPDHPEKRSGSFSSSPAKHHNSQTSDPPQIQQDCSSRSRSLSRLSIISTHGQPQKRQVTYKMVVSGGTFNAHKQLLDRLTTSSGDKVLKLLSQEDGEVIIVFCPVVSRMGTDVEAAMAKITGDKPVILVVMHHTYGARSVSSAKTWKDSCKVVLCVHVFYHKKVPGLLSCQENNDAIFKIRTELLKYGVDITESTSGDTQNWFSFLASKFTEKK
ncbi:cortactin-binding protein 2-like isoform X17 [Oreochromis aureus]|uniref:cortactin-binding protein 2-like isoform X16 n=1 Tax=Oreochromis aureus TaxID=47969 RepID=UPI001954387F|nr:cortactin-binding protein 2-like isoform X16 [Oreochromis aureus]XP_039454881.1 cortactin-binding protein 2-like isoform X17 [Oreochromis aureus]